MCCKRVKKTGAGILVVLMLAAMVSLPVFAEDVVPENPVQTEDTDKSTPSDENGDTTPGDETDTPHTPEPGEGETGEEETGEQTDGPGEIIPAENQGAGNGGTSQYAEVDPDTIADAPLDSTPVTSFDPNDFSALISSEAASSQLASGFAFSDEEKSDGGASWMFFGGIALVVLAVAGIAFFVYNQFIAPGRKRAKGTSVSQRKSPAVQAAYTAKSKQNPPTEKKIPAEEKKEIDWDAFFEQNKKEK